MPTEESSKKTPKTKAKPKAGPKSKAAPVTSSKEKKSKNKVGAPKLPHNKKWRAANAKIAVDQRYSVAEASKILASTAITKFVSTAELHVHLGHEGRGSIQLPHQIGKKVRVAIATDEVIDEIAAGKINFDVLISEPAQMTKLAKHARTLGPKGLMPNPKSGTVTTEVNKVKEELEAGKMEYRTDAGKNVHLVIGKADSKPEELEANIDAALTTLQPLLLKSATLSSTMGPGIKLVLPEA